MIRVLFLLSILTLLQHADMIDPACPPLFAEVTGVKTDDVLNVREKPEYESKKVGTQVPNAFMGVARCKQSKKSIWCKVYQMTQYYNFEDFNPGWVNARFLKPFNRGYVLIDGAGNCDYALQCKENKCEVVSGYDRDENHEITNLRTKWIERDRLKGESHFGAMSLKEDGYCTNGTFIVNYLNNKGYKKKGE